jgi:stage II sporulation protein AA (anti-sigma F factor antagonist)
MNFENITFMDSSGIGLVMGRYRNLSRSGAELHIEGVPEQMYKMMKLAGLDKLVRLSQKDKRKDK